MKEYASRFGLENTMIITNWIARGVVPADHVITVPHLNDTKLIKAVQYKK
jgi:hypothetical protein